MTRDNCNLFVFVWIYLDIKISDFYLDFHFMLERIHPLYYLLHKSELADGLLSRQCFNYLEKFVTHFPCLVSNNLSCLGTRNVKWQSQVYSKNAQYNYRPQWLREKKNEYCNRSIIVKAVIEFLIRIIYFINDKNKISSDI